MTAAHSATSVAQVKELIAATRLSLSPEHPALLWVNDFNDSLQIFQGRKFNDDFASGLANLNCDSGV
jgi:hypothetical protein